MANSFYTPSGYPATGSAGTSATLRNELALVSAGFDKLPTLAGNANKLALINSSGTALTVASTLTETGGGLIYSGTLTGGTGVVALGTNQFYKDASGNVGIGTATPATKLQVGDGTATTEIRIDGDGGSGNGSFIRGYKDTINPSWFVGDLNPIAGGTNSGLCFYSYGATPQVFYTNGLTRMTLDSSGNLGLGVTPSAWGLGKAIEVNGLGNAVWGVSAGNMLIAANMYYSGDYKYATTTFATQYQQTSGQHRWFNAPSGTAGNTITFTQAMTLDASGNLGIGTLTPGAKLDVVGQIRSSSVLTAGYVAGADNTYIASNGATGGGCVMATLNFAQNAYQPITYDASYYAWRPGGTEGMRLTSTGLGIGTISPSAKLHVVGSQAIVQNTSGAYTIWKDGTPTKAGRMAFNVSATDALEWGLFDGASWSSAMVLNTSGNLGLGVTPSAWSGLKGVQTGFGSFTNNLTGDWTNIASNAYFDGTNWRYIGATTSTWYRQLSGAHSWFNAPSGTAGNAISFTQAMTLDASGRLGIGNTLPARPLDVLGTASGVAIFKNSTAAGFAEITVSSDDRSFSIGQRSSTNAGGDLAYLYSGTATPIAFFTNTQERARITSGGDVGIGVTPTSYGAGYTTLAVNNTTAGVLDLMANSVSQFRLFGNAGENRLQGVTNVPMTFYTNNTEKARITSGGNLLVGTTTDWGRLTVTAAASGWAANFTDATAGTQGFTRFLYGSTAIGSITGNNTATAYNTTSDQRLKTNIVDAPDASALIDSIKVRSYDWIADNSHQRYGMVAQELFEVAPEAVHAPADPDEMMAVDYSKLVPMLIKEIQSLRARVASLETQP